LYLVILICDGAHLRRRSGNAAFGIFSARQIGWIESRRATQAHRLLPGMKIKSSGDAARPLRQIPLQFSHFATKGEIRRESSGGCGRFTPQEFREQRFHHRNRSSL